MGPARKTWILVIDKKTVMGKVAATKTVAIIEVVVRAFIVMTVKVILKAKVRTQSGGKGYYAGGIDGD